ncbi:MAG TPA: universal stress protein [Methylomirabilota bacterium]
MPRFRSILLHACPGPGAEAALRRTIDLARRHGAAVRVVDVIVPPPVYARPFLTDDIKAVVEEHRTRHFEETLDRFRREDVQATGEILRGRVSTEIVETVLRHKHDLVIRGDKGRVNDKPAVYGPSDIELLRECPCAVWMVRPESMAGYRRVVAAVDPDVPEEGEEGLNRRIVQAALDVADLTEAEVLVVSTWAPFGESLLQPRMTEEEYAGWMAEVEGAARSARDRVVESFGSRAARIERHLVKGEPAAALVQFAVEHDASLLVMGSVGRTGIRGLVMGNTAERALREVTCDVLVLKPEGFVPHR